MMPTPKGRKLVGSRDQRRAHAIGTARTSEALRPRVLIVAPTMGVYGGIEAFVISLTRHLELRADVEVRACFKVVARRSVSSGLAEQIALAGINCVIVKRASAELARQLAWADLVHGQNASPDICLLSKFFGKHLVLTIHNHMYGRQTLRARIWKWAMRLAQRRWYNSRFVRGSWERGPESSRSEAFAVVPAITRRFAPIDGRRGFVFVARMIENKGADTLLEAYVRAALDPHVWPLRMIGDGPLLADLRARFGSIKGVSFHGFVSSAQKDEMISAARWMVTPPNTQEDMGITPLEARRKGVPCIVSRDGGLPEVAGDEALLCEPGNTLDLAGCLQTAAAMPDAEYVARSHATFETVEQQIRPLDWYTQSYLELLDRLRPGKAAL